MAGSRFRWFVVGLSALSGAGLLGLTSIMHSAYAFGETPGTDPDPTTIGLVIGGSGLPIPGSNYVEAADTLYIHPHFPDTSYPGVLANGLFTPEGLYPLTGVHTLPFNYPADPTTGFPALSTSVGQGMTIVENAINSNHAAHDISTVFGYSQSSTISGLVMQQLAGVIPKDDLQFVLLGDPSAPNGGLLERFNGFETLSGHTTVLSANVPSLGVSFDGATPADDFHTVIYSMEYDGFADFPRYPLNLLADINAFLGIATLHGTMLNQALGLPGGPTPTDIADAKLLPGSMDSPADQDPCGCLTNYYMIDTIDGQQITPPLVSLLGSIPMIGKPLEDLLGPDLTALINLGYGDPDFGYSTDPADIATPFGLLPSFSDFLKLPGALWDGTIKGFTDFFNDLFHPAAADAATATATGSAAAFTSLSDFINALSGAASALYSALLPTADIVNALSTTLPAYDVSLFVDNLQTGDLLDAIGLPIAADLGLFTLAAGFELQIVVNAIGVALSHF